MKKADLIAAIQAEIPGVPKGQIQTVLDGIAAAAATVLARGEDFSIPGIARITIVDRGARTGRNPATGATIEIAAKTVVKLKPAAELKRLVA